MNKAEKGGLQPDRPGVIILPPVLYGLLFALGLVAGFIWPAHIGFPGGADLWRGIGAAMGVLALLLGGWAVVAFRRAGTHVEPTRPALTVVASGPYRFSRNPMYVALTLLYCGLALVLDNPWILLGLVIIFPVMSIGVVRREERYLSTKFGRAYEDYRARVRRWF